MLPDAAGTANQLDVQPATDFVHHQFLGTLLTKPGTEVWAAAYGADAGAFVKLKSCTKTGSGERLTTTAAHLPAGYGPFADCQLEGFVWTVAAPPSGTVQTELGIQAVELRRYKQLFGADYLTTALPPPPGYGPGVQLGWIIEPRYL